MYQPMALTQAEIYTNTILVWLTFLLGLYGAYPIWKDKYPEVKRYAHYWVIVSQIVALIVAICFMLFERSLK